MAKHLRAPRSKTEKSLRDDLLREADIELGTETAGTDHAASVHAALAWFRFDQKLLCGLGKSFQAVMAKEVLVVIGRDAGATVVQLSEITGLDTSSVSRGYEAAKQKAERNHKLAYARSLVERQYHDNIAESQA